MAVINKDIQYMALPLAIRRGNPFPVDEYAVWYDMETLQEYASSNPVAYVGQVVTLVNETEGTVEAYVIQNSAGTLVKLAATTASGDLTEDVIELQGQVATIIEEIGEKGEDGGIIATDIWSAIKEIKAAYEAADTSTNEKFTNYYNKSETDSQIDSKIATAISTTYKPAGSVAFEALPALSSTEEGKVYNITNEFTTNENFVEGAGKKYPAGTNVVCIDTDDSGTYKWDVLSGFVDLSAYETTASVDEKLNGKVDKVAGSSLVEDTDIAKLKALATIKSTSEELEITGDGVLGVKSIEQEKVNGLPTALAEKLSELKLGSEEKLQAEDGVVTIPIATSVALGVVKSSEEENKVTVTSDGTMEVKKLNVSKLTQSAEDTLILNGGAANS